MKNCYTCKYSGKMYPKCFSCCNYSINSKINNWIAKVPVSTDQEKQKILDLIEVILDMAISGQDNCSYDRDVLESIYNIFQSKVLHPEKASEVTDQDIEDWANKSSIMEITTLIKSPVPYCYIDNQFKVAITIGAKAMRDGLIKHK